MTLTRRGVLGALAALAAAPLAAMKWKKAPRVPAGNDWITAGIPMQQSIEVAFRDDISDMIEPGQLIEIHLPYGRTEYVVRGRIVDGTLYAPSIEYDDED